MSAIRRFRAADSFFAFETPTLPKIMVTSLLSIKSCPGANTIVLTALPAASPGTFNVEVTVLAGNNPQSHSFILNVKPLPLIQWEYRMERAPTERELESVAAALGQQSWELVSVVYRERDSNGLPEWTAFSSERSIRAVIDLPRFTKEACSSTL
jgi:hypothetical protein